MKFPCLQVEDFSFSFSGDSQPLWEGLNFKLQPGEALAVTGPSGCGKSTFCYCLSGIIPHHLPGIIRGKILVKGQNTASMNLPRLAQEVGMVFQDPETQLFCTTVEEELAFGPENLCLEPAEIKDRVDQVLDVLEMNHYRHHNPAHLSGGEQQLIALGSVLTLNPHTLILDEALSQLDQDGQKRVQNIIRKLKRDGRALILVDHQVENLTMADQHLKLANCQATWR